MNDISGEVICSILGLLVGLMFGVLGLTLTLFNKQLVKSNQKLMWILDDFEKIANTSEKSEHSRNQPEFPTPNDFLEYSEEIRPLYGI